MSRKQIAMAKDLAGTMPRDEIAKKLDCSLANLKRSCPGTKFTFFNRWANNPDFVKELCAYYEKHGRRPTERKYPHAKIRSIVEHYKFFSPRQVRWKGAELVEAVKMAGLVSHNGQAKYFKRPRANEGSIKSLWYKKFKIDQPQYRMHGLTKNKAIWLCKSTVPFIETGFGPQNCKFAYHIALWIDVEKHLKPGIPDSFKDGIYAMARFQRKLFGDKNTKSKIIKMMKTREI